MNLNGFDLNLLRVFDALLKEGNVTKAGLRIGLSQPAVSSALNRLRRIFHDDLFVRSGHCMVPTPRANFLAVSITGALDTLERGFEIYQSIEPARFERRYTLLGADFFSTLLMPRLAAMTKMVAPGIRLRLLDAARGDIAELLQHGEIDVALDHLAVVPPSIREAPLFRSCFVFAAAPGHALLDRAEMPEGSVVAPELAARLNFAVYSFDGGEAGCAVEILREAGLGDRIMLALPHFQATALAATEGDLVALLPCQFAEAVAGRLGLVIYRPPADFPTIQLSMYWHRRAEDDPQHRWLRDQIVATIDMLGFDRAVERYTGHEAASVGAG